MYWSLFKEMENQQTHINMEGINNEGTIIKHIELEYMLTTIENSYNSNWGENMPIKD